jgi:periplasmic divalent cation tolerance protein
MTDVRLVFMTAPDEALAAQIAECLVDEELVACGNIIPGVRSIYRWEGKVCDDPEVLVLFKTLAAKVPLVSERIQALHPYDNPEVVAVSVEGGSQAYLDWVGASVRP